MMKLKAGWVGRAALLAAVAGCAGPAWGQRTPGAGRGFTSSEVRLGHIPVLRVSPNGRPWSSQGGGATDACNVQASLTTSTFQPGTYAVQAGLGETEMVAATYTVAASEFPIKINLTEVLLAMAQPTQNVVVTHWSLLYYSGTPLNGNLVESFSSDDELLPHARIGPTQVASGLNIQFSIDPGDPEQLIIPDNGSHQFTVAFRIDHHNQQVSSPCNGASALPDCCNAFPATDCVTGGCTCAGPFATCQANFQSDNWLFGLNCGPLGCPAGGGWSTFSNLNVLCRPHGDWVMRTTWSGVNCTPGIGACCKPDGTCQQLSPSACSGVSGAYQGDGVDCASANCPQPSGACCFPATGGCLIRTQAQCTASSGNWLGLGTTCNGSLCPTTGSCCLPAGTCSTGLTSAQCTGQGGVFRGLGTGCAGANCPDLRGACCTSTGCTLETQGDCTIIGGLWQGTGTACATACTGACCTTAGCTIETATDCGIIGGTWLGAGTACAACSPPPCYANCDNSTTAPVLNVQDFGCFLNAFASAQTYANCDNSTAAPVLNVQDFGCFLNRFATGCS